ncbi:MAG: RDD family protein [Archangium sp.]|nr:RDD family protein [Archangium sp.]
MSSDPKKLDATPSGTPDLLQKDLSLDRRRRVPTFDELQAVPTEPMRPATPRPPVGNEAATQTVQKLVPPGLQPRAARAVPPSPVEFAQSRPHAMPQVTPSVPQQGALVPEGQSTPNRPQPALRPATAPAAHAAPAVAAAAPAPAPARSFTPVATVPKPAALPAEMLVTQPGLPGPFAQARGMPQNQAIPQRPPSLPALPRVAAPQARPVFEEPLLPGEGPVVTAEPAALWRRTGAYLTDLLFVGVLVLSFLSIAMAVIAPKTLTPLQQLISIAVPGLALAAVLAFVYSTLFAVLWSGRTPGRRLMGIHLVDSTGQAPGPTRALIRGALSLVSFGLFLSGFWLALFDRHGQTLHDKLTRTFVVKLQDA